MAGYSVLYKHKKPRNAYLLLASLFFYYKSSGVYVLLLIFSIVTDFYIGKGIHSINTKWKRVLMIALSVFINLLVLSYFKYAHLFLDTINSVFGADFKVVNHFNLMMNATGHFKLDIDRIVLPVGISFFTFQSMSYIIDIYRKKLEPLDSILDYGFYVSFFPQLVAGPIVRASVFIPQIYKDYKVSKFEFGMAVFMILNGLLKKLFISDYIAVNLIDRVYSNPVAFTGVENLLAIYAYSMQVYADFSGYTDIAIGVALLMGFRLSTNFNSPYKATDVGGFWKRWHMSLSSWLKDYLYIPLGGSRHGEFRANINLMITMLIGGLWHGASWQFVIWGGLNGIAIVIYKQWKKISPFDNNNSWMVRFYSIFLTFNFITLTRIWFRGESMQKVDAMMGQILNAFHFEQIGEIAYAYKNILILLIFAFVVHWLPETFKQKYRSYFANLPDWAMALAIIVIVVFIYQFQTFELQPFIYFAF
jgi:alginate O-acetyltransferase complex protein AlgI